MFDHYPEFIDTDPRIQRSNDKSYKITKEFTTKRYSAFFDHIDLTGKTILDIGSCVSSLGAWVLEKGADFYQAIEFSDSLCQKANDNLSKYWRKDKWNIFTGYAEDYFINDSYESHRLDRFDYIVASGIIYAYLNPSELIDECVKRSNNIIIESRNPVKRWVEEHAQVPLTLKHTRLLERQPMVLAYEDAKMLYSEGGNYSYTGTCPTQGYVDYYFNAQGYSEDGVVHQKLQKFIPDIYNIDKRFGKMYVKTHESKGAGFKESIENNEVQVTEFNK